MTVRKPNARRQNRGTRDVGLVAKSTDVDVPPPPHPPGRKLLAESVRSWEAFWSSELAGMVQVADRPALERLWRLYDLRARLERLVLKEPMVEGSQGQPRLNPAASEVGSLDARILQLEDRFGLSPSARLKLGVTFGQAARSLEELNRDFDGDDAAEDDPRLTVIDTTATG